MRAPSPSVPARWPVALASAGAWAALVPYAAHALGWRLEVSARVEVVDHVVPGAVMLGAALLLRAGAGRAQPVPGDARWSAAAGAVFLAGFWIAATHAPLLAEAADGVSPWDAALLHSSAALPALAASVAMLVLPLTGPR